MIRTTSRLFLVFMAITALMAPTTGHTHTEDVLALDVLVNDRPLNEFHARNATYIEAVKHAEYSLRLTNRTGRRMAVALAVDGLNTIDAKSGSASKASKWVLAPWQTITIEGWQIGADDARKFFFTSEDKSYGAWLGKTSNLGVIEAVAFRENIPPPPPRRPYSEQEERDSSRLRSLELPAPQSAGKAAPVPPTESLDDEMAATGIGRKIDHRVTRVHLELESSPAAKIRLRYEFREQLVQLGVLPSADEEQALARRERANGFDDFDFAPDPWGGK